MPPKGSGIKDRTQVTAYMSADEAQRLKAHAQRDGRSAAAALRLLALEALAAREAAELQRTA
jgi:hypothetical protein